MRLTRLCLVALMGIAMVGCADGDDQLAPTSASSTTMGVLQTRVTTDEGGSNDEGDMTYPVSLYAIGSNGVCASTASLTATDAAAEMTLDAGTYTVIAVTGVAPTIATDAKTSDVMLTTTPKVDADLQLGSASATLSAGETTDCNIQLKRQVLSIESIDITNIPTGTTKVALTVGNLYSTLAMDGTKSGTGQHTITLTDKGNGTWSAASATFLLPSNGNAELSIVITDGEGNEKAYSLKTNEALAANYQYAIALAYDPGLTPTEETRMQVTVSGDTWMGKKSLTMNFTPSDEESVMTSGDAPEVGTLYNGAYVLQSVATSSGTTITLMTTNTAKHDNSRTFFSYGGKSYTLSKASSQSDWASCMAKVIPAMTTEQTEAGITGWHVATYAEASYFAEHRDEVKTALTALGCSTDDFKTAYMPIYDEGQYAKMKFADKSISQYDAATPGSVLYLRAFATVTFAK